jgi:hypothetical protein
VQESEQRYRGLFQFMAMPLWRVEWHKAMEMFSSLRADGVIDLDAYLDEHLEFSGRVMDAVRIVEVKNDGDDVIEGLLKRSIQRLAVRRRKTAARRDRACAVSGRSRRQESLQAQGGTLYIQV